MAELATEKYVNTVQLRGTVSKIMIKSTKTVRFGLETRHINKSATGVGRVFHNVAVFGPELIQKASSCIKEGNVIEITGLLHNEKVMNTPNWRPVISAKTLKEYTDEQPSG